MKNKTGIAIFTHYSRGGAFLYLSNLARAFEEKHFPVIVYLPKDAQVAKGSCVIYEKVFLEPSIPLSFLRIKPLKYLHHLFKYLFNSVMTNPNEDVKIVHLLFPYYFVDFVTVWRLKRKGIKVILTVHEARPHKHIINSFLDLLIMKKMYSHADVLLVHSEFLKREFLRFYPVLSEQVHVVPHGYYEPVQSQLGTQLLKNKYGVPNDRKVLLFFGNIRENKGLHFLIESMKFLKERCFLLIAGRIAGASEKGAEFYRRQIEKNGISESLLWIERFISDGEAAEVFKIADLVVLPYTRSFHAQSAVLQLAVGYEKPCVVTDVGGLGEVVNAYNLGTVVEPEDPVALYRGVLSLIDNHGTYGFERYKSERGWGKVADKLIEEYTRLL